MQHQENQIQTIEVNPVLSDSHPSKITDLTDLFGSFLIVFGLLMGIKKLWRSIDLLRKHRKFNPKLVFPIVSALLAIVRAILQMNDEE